MAARMADWGRFVLLIGLHGIGASLLIAFVLDGAFDVLGEQRRRMDDSASAIAQAASRSDTGSRVAGIEPSQVDAATRLFVQGRTQSLLIADLLTSLRQIAEGHGIVLASVATLAEREWSGLRFVGVRIEFAAPTPQAAAFLLDVDEGDRLLFSGRTRLSPVKNSDDPSEVVSVSVEVHGATRWQPR
jgi:hypothetical protein